MPMKSPHNGRNTRMCVCVRERDRVGGIKGGWWRVMVGKRNIMLCTEVCTQAKGMAAHEGLHVSGCACAPLRAPAYVCPH